MVWGVTGGLGQQASWGGQKVGHGSEEAFLLLKSVAGSVSPALLRRLALLALTRLQLPPLCVLPQDWLFASQAGPSAEPQPPLLVALALWEREAVSGTRLPPNPPHTLGSALQASAVASVRLRCLARGQGRAPGL